MQDLVSEIEDLLAKFAYQRLKRANALFAANSLLLTRSFTLLSCGYRFHGFLTGAATETPVILVEEIDS